MRGNYFRFILSTHTVNSARHMLKKDSLCFVCITAHTIAAPVSPLSLLLRTCSFSGIGAAFTPAVVWSEAYPPAEGGRRPGVTKGLRGGCGGGKAVPVC